MFTKRIIPCLDVKDGRVVKGVNFVDLRDAGDPVEIAAAYDKAGADEVVFLDITASSDKQTNNPYGNEVRYHKVKSGETIVTIAHKRGVSVEQIIRLNHLGKNQSVRPGQILRYS